MTSTSIALITVLVLGWLLAASIGTWAYFANEPLARNRSGGETD